MVSMDCNPRVHIKTVIKTTTPIKKIQSVNASALFAAFNKGQHLFHISFITYTISTSISKIPVLVTGSKVASQPTNFYFIKISQDEHR